ncbi:MAG: molybdenum cofactor biosynthesis protein [Deltaproteobacteria bacterium]|nr:molybdenum cofactor biosynthesis protein [Deltaproteobacteria bacterium]
MDLSNAIAHIKQKTGFTKNVGMILMHNGTVRELSEDNKRRIQALEVKPDQEKIEQIRLEFLGRPGIFDIVIYAREGIFQPGEDLLFLIVAGDIRENVEPALADLLDRVKGGPIAKREIII